MLRFAQRTYAGCLRAPSNAGMMPLSDHIPRLRLDRAHFGCWANPSHLRRRQPSGALVVAAVLTAFGLPAAADDDLWVTYADTAGDAVARVTDPGADGPFDPEAHPLVDLLRLTIGKWSPDAPEADLFAGSFGVKLSCSQFGHRAYNVDVDSFHPCQPNYRKKKNQKKKKKKTKQHKTTT